MSDIDLNSSSVQSYLAILQSVISRMAANSASCKTWCITIVSAIAVLVADKAQPEYVWIAIAPIIVFLALDSYYLGLERLFRDQYNAFIGKIHSGTVQVEDLFVVTPGAGSATQILSAFSAFFSIAVWPFYTMLVIMLVVIYEFVL